MKGLLLLAFFISVVVFLMSASLFFFYMTPVSKFSYQATAMVTEDSGGFDVNSTALTFGSVALGGSSTRAIFINNSYSFPVKVESVIEGSIARIIIPSSIIIQPFETSSFKITVFADLNASLGNYMGNVSIQLLRA